MATTSQQGSGPPPKPWEGAASSSGPAPFRPPSAGTTSDVVEASGTAKPGEIVTTTSNQNNNTVNTNVVGRPLPARPWESNYGNSSYGGYGSGLTSGLNYNSGYGTSGYGSSMYNSYGGGYGGVGGVGGMYGNSMYRGGYGGGGLYGSGGYGGGGMYNNAIGGPMGGYGNGMGGPFPPQDPNNPPASPPGFWISFLRVMEGVVNMFGRISFLVDQNTQAVHFFMTALLQLFNHGGMLYGELAGFVFRILGARRRSRKINPSDPNGLPLAGPNTQMDQRFIDAPKSAPTGSWDNVILAVSIISKSGKALLSRQFVKMSRIRVEGYLAAFPKLIGSGKQHTYVETENVRYVYQPIESLYLVILTSKQSNILEDLETLRILSKVIPEYAPYLDEEEISHAAFELIFAFDEAISLGHRENITVSQVKQYCEMESQEEKLHKIMLQNKINETKDIMKRKASEIGKKKVERTRSGKVLLSLQSMGSGGFERTLSDLGLSSSNGVSGSGVGSSGFGLGADMDSLISKPKGMYLVIYVNLFAVLLKNKIKYIYDIPNVLSMSSASPSAAATGPSKGRGMQLGKTQRTNQFLQSLKAEGEEIIEDVRPTSTRSTVAVSPIIIPVLLSVEEKLSVTLKRDGGLANFDVQGTLSLQILEEKDAYLQVQVESKNDSRVLFKTHPNINKELFSSENMLGLKDPNRPFPTGQSGEGVGLLKWRMQSTDESVVPLTINCWPSVSGNETDVSIEYEASSTIDMKNVIILVPLPSLRDPPNVRHIDGEWRYDPRNSVLEWSILFIDNSNRSGSVEFAVPTTDPSAFYPISVQFTAIDTFSGLKVANVIPLKGSSPPNFAQRTHLCTENYRVI
ncbi:hypothetical protein KSS87_017234 [Heliosperma pusillum]|nr:hypothetical protein KSS87_017234 [Heliosperma pusillum]